MSFVIDSLLRTKEVIDSIVILVTSRRSDKIKPDIMPRYKLELLIFVVIHKGPLDSTPGIILSRPDRSYFDRGY